MIIEICNIIVFLIEISISLFYFESKFEKKLSYKLILPFAGIICFVLYLIQNIKIPVLNAAFYIALNFLFLYMCYNSNIKSSIFSIVLLTSLMIVTEMIVMYISSLIFGIKIDLCLTDDFTFAIQAMIAKLLFFIFIYIISRFSVKEQKILKIRSVLLLSILPTVSVLLMHTTIYICIYNNLSDYFKSLLVICNIMILLSNIIVFYIHELTLKNNQKLAKLSLTHQKETNSYEYYKILKQQNENSKLLIHDISKHLNSIRMLSSDSNADIKDYIDKIIDEFNITNPINYCNNALLNLITYHYSEICKSYNIKFEVNIQNAKLEFMSDPDITAMFDNILENAVEAANQTTDKFINFSIDIRNTNFIIITITNSSNQKPLISNKAIVTTKSNCDEHGFGIKSIRNIVRKYDGNIEMNYNNSKKYFSTKITFQLNKH